MKKLFLLILTLGLLSSFATNDLVITSIARTADCTTLRWASHTGEFYTVYWTDNLVPPVFWRVGQANVPSGGTNTTWREGCCAGESMMMSRATSGGWESLSEKERAEKLEAATARSEEGIKFLTEKLQATTNTSGTKSSEGESMLASRAPSTSSEMKFYRVGKVPPGFVDGWGVVFGAPRPAISNVIAVSASPRYAGQHGMALRADGTVTNWGANSYGQCNVPAGLSNVVAIAAGGRHSAAVRRDGSVTSWGDNLLGQITNMPPNLTNVVDVKAGLWHTLALRADGTVTAWGDLYIRTNPVPAGLSGVRAISAGPRHNLALKCDGTVVAWGFTHPNLLNNFLPTNVPAGLGNVIAISAGMEHNQALLADGSVVVWGNTNNPGVAGAVTLTNVAALSAGWHYGAALLADSTVQGWGQGDTEITMDSVVSLAAGADQTLVVRTNDDAPVIRAHPRSVFPPLGATTNFGVSASSVLALTYQWQRSLSEIWTDLPDATNTTLTLTNIQDGANGSYRVRVSTPLRTIPSRSALLEVLHAPVIAAQTPELELRRPQFSYELLSVLITNQGARFLRYEWFKNGQPAALAMGSSLVLYFNRTNDEGNYHVVVSNPAGAITSQVWHASVTLSGEATAWGDDTYGQISHGRSRHETNLVAIAAGAFHTLGLRENGSVVAWGDNTGGQTNVPVGLSNVVAVAGGDLHSLALLDNGTVRAWGQNASGQANVPGGLTNVTAIAAGG